MHGVAIRSRTHTSHTPLAHTPRTPSAARRPTPPLSGYFDARGQPPPGSPGALGSPGRGGSRGVSGGGSAISGAGSFESEVSYDPPRLSGVDTASRPPLVVHSQSKVSVALRRLGRGRAPALCPPGPLPPQPFAAPGFAALPPARLLSLRARGEATRGDFPDPSSSLAPPSFPCMQIYRPAWIGVKY